MRTLMNMKKIVMVMSTYMEDYQIQLRYYDMMMMMMIIDQHDTDDYESDNGNMWGHEHKESNCYVLRRHGQPSGFHPPHNCLTNIFMTINIILTIVLTNIFLINIFMSIVVLIIISWTVLKHIVLQGFFLFWIFTFNR